MSEISCESCAVLREQASEFVQNGVTDNVSASLKNNTGFNPALTVLHDNCTDLNNANDCLIGRMGDEVKAYDNCDWKEFMGKYIPNNYEMLKAIIASDCGEWSRIAALCDSVDSIMSVLLGLYVAGHTGTLIEAGLTKITPTHPELIFVPFLECEKKKAIGCDASKQTLYMRAGFEYEKSAYPIVPGYGFTNIQVGDKLATFNKNDFVPIQASEQIWNDWLRGANLYRLGILNGDTYVFVRLRGYVVLEGVAFNEDLRGLYPDGTAVMEAISFIGPSRSGGMTRNYMQHDIIIV